VTEGGKTLLIGGSVRSGKTAFALACARRLGGRRVYLATAEAGDGEMARRIEAHRSERGADFATVEEPVHLMDTLSQIESCDVVVVDCLTLWLSNVMLREESPLAASRKADELASAAGRFPFHLVLVTNEVGMGIVPETELGRMFRDVAGRAHQRLAQVADEIYFAALGVMLRLRPGPVTTVQGSEFGVPGERQQQSREPEA
jgi:adenosylcobinamide kinase / adenosylcobinamide-phosphate guanylyltransferase